MSDLINKEQVKEEVEKKTNVATAPVVNKSTLIEKKFILKALPIIGYQSLPAEILKTMDDFRRISSEMLSINGVPTPNVIKGLTREQEENLESFHARIGASPSEPEFRKKAEEFWREFSFKVFMGKDMKLDASYTEKEIDDNLIQVPAHFEDYIKANFCLVSSKVANSEDEINTSFHTCLLLDVSIEKQRSIDNLKEANKADTNYVALLNNENKINWMVSVLEDTFENMSESSVDEKLLFLREKKTKNPELFNSIFENTHLEQEALIFEARKAGIIVEDDNTFYFEDKPLGTLTQTVRFLLVPTNTPILTKIKHQLAETKTKKINN